VKIGGLFGNLPADVEQLLRTIPSGLFVVDCTRRIRYWNAEAERITGFPAAEALGQDCSFLRGVPCGRRCGLFEDNIAKPLIGISCSIRTRDGQRIVLSKNVDLLRDEQGKVIGGMESFVDITTRKRLERGLRRQARQLEQTVRQRTAELDRERIRLRIALDAMDDLACIVSGDYQVEFMNRPMMEVFGDYTDKNCHQVFHHSDTPCAWCPFPEVASGQTVREERYMEIKGRFYEVLHTPLWDIDGRIQKLAVYRDVTQRRKTEEKLRETNRELQSFVSTVSHDLRAPLTPIIGYAEFLFEEYRDRLDEPALTILKDIRDQGRRMMTVMEDLLILSRVGKIPPPERPVEVAAVVDKILKELAPQIKREGVKVDRSPLPALFIPATFLFQIFGNLIGNALRYGGGTCGRIEIGSRRSGGVALYVRDFGPGVPPEERDSIFEPFFRGATVRETPGTGIGLAIVKKIILRYGGQITLEETAGGGCTFLMEFPTHSDALRRSPEESMEGDSAS
jgi:PAS domain S-box-containing protein